MLDLSNAYAGDFVAAEQLQEGARYQAVITAVTVEKVTQPQTGKAADRVILSLRATTGQAWPQRLVLNKTNFKTCRDALGMDGHLWVDRALDIWRQQVQLRDSMVAGVRLSVLPMAQPQPVQPAAQSVIPLGAPAQPSAPNPTPNNGAGAAQAPIPGVAPDNSTEITAGPIPGAVHPTMQMGAGQPGVPIPPAGARAEGVPLSQADVEDEIPF